MHLKISSARCTGCHLCALVCAFQKGGNLCEDNGAIRVDGEFPESLRCRIHFCFQCKEEYCVEACHTGALGRSDRGYVALDETLCDTCKGAFECVKACKYQGIHVNAEKTAPVKIVDRIHQSEFHFRTIKSGSGFYLGSGPDLLFFPMPSIDDLHTKYYQWWRSAQM